ncbi:MAG: DASH family cryptochrome [Bacteroidia bacterium]
MKHKRAILWFRNDLRLHDHEALAKALDQSEALIPVYCLDPRLLEQGMFGLPRIGSHRLHFLLESLADLQASLRARGADLAVLVARPEEALPRLAGETGATAVFAHKEAATEELAVEAALEQALFRRGIPLNLYWGSTLHHLEDLPMPVQALPEVFTQYRKQAEKFVQVRRCYPVPRSIPYAAIDAPDWPTPASLGHAQPQSDARAVLPFRGGETAALERLAHYFWQTDSLRNYKETRNGLLGADYSSKFSPWLALGCISPRQIYTEVQRYERERKKNDSTYWLIFELIWRDYFRFIAYKHGNRIFLPGGIRQATDAQPGNPHMEHFDRWVNGNTGMPFVDANMRELLATGFMSNRGRQNVASFLVHDLGLDWRMGAAWFEAALIDYDVCSNWCNWNYVAGVGNDPRENRYFHVLSQARRYDPRGEYVRHWLPELAALPGATIHAPYELHARELASFGVKLGATYPHLLVIPGRQTA